MILAGGVRHILVRSEHGRCGTAGADDAVRAADIEAVWSENAVASPSRHGPGGLEARVVVTQGGSLSHHLY